MELFILMFKLAGEPDWTPYLDHTIRSAMPSETCQGMVIDLTDFFGPDTVAFKCQSIGVPI